ncbi:Na+/H+ antiporter NhaA [Thermoleophilia bacterium SCSIO 60948]|nr:Na+/H+ antiporter NhaA [Thermoleophilia bacterium SCSIO 60948]
MAGDELDPYSERSAVRAPEPFPRPWLRSQRPVPRRLGRPLERFLSVETGSGAVLLLGAIAALVWANLSPGGYEDAWSQHLAIGIGSLEIDESLRHWISDLLMAVFFFLIALEVKREFLFGDLADRRVAAVPIAAAIGGMVVPAGLFLLINSGSGGEPSGWAIPIATDVAFALAVLAAIGRMAPSGLRAFLLTVAIADDIGTIVVIAIFYTSDLSLVWLGGALGAAALVWAFNRAGVRMISAYVALAGLLWITMHESGVHATIAGVIIGLLTPARPFHDPDVTAEAITHDLRRVLQTDDKEIEEGTMISTARLAREAAAPLTRMEHKLHPWSAYLILPLFALANAGIPLSGEVLSGVFTQPIGLGIVAGLLLGKPLGLLLASGLAVRGFGGSMPPGITVGAFAPLGLIAGIGFTVAIFIADLALTGEELAEAKAAILIGSALSAVLALTAFALRRPRTPRSG